MPIIHHHDHQPAQQRRQQSWAYRPSRQQAKEEQTSLLQYTKARRRVSCRQPYATSFAEKIPQNEPSPPNRYRSRTFNCRQPAARFVSAAAANGVIEPARRTRIRGLAFASQIDAATARVQTRCHVTFAAIFRGGIRKRGQRVKASTQGRRCHAAGDRN